MHVTRHEVSQPPYGTVNVFRVGETLVDTGHMASRDELAELLDIAAVERVVLTHPHPDHVGGSQTWPALAAKPHVVFEGIPSILRAYNEYLARVHEDMFRLGAGLDDAIISAVAETHFGQGAYTEEDIQVARVVSDGDTVLVGGHSCEVIHTPGHNYEHVALWHADSGTLFSADLVSPNGHFLYGPLSADLAAYKDSLRRIRALDADRLAPGHGPCIDNPRERIDDALAKARAARRSIRETVDGADEPVSAQQLARDVFGATAGSLAFLTFVAGGYLQALADEGVVSVSITEKGVFATPARN